MSHFPRVSIQLQFCHKRPKARINSLFLQRKSSLKEEKKKEKGKGEGSRNQKMTKTKVNESVLIL
jgi:hypothetical protein